MNVERGVDYSTINPSSKGNWNYRDKRSGSLRGTGSFNIPYQAVARFELTRREKRGSERMKKEDTKVDSRAETTDSRATPEQQFPARKMDAKRKVWAHLNPHHHIQMTLAVLLDDVADVVRFPSLLKLSASHEVLDFSDCPDSVSVRLCQPAKAVDLGIRDKSER